MVHGEGSPRYAQICVSSKAGPFQGSRYADLGTVICFAMSESILTEVGWGVLLVGPASQKKGSRHRVLVTVYHSIILKALYNYFLFQLLMGRGSTLVGTLTHPSTPSKGLKTLEHFCAAEAC